MLFVEGKNNLQFVNFKRSSPKIVVNFCCKGAQVHFFCTNHQNLSADRNRRGVHY